MGFSFPALVVLGLLRHATAADDSPLHCCFAPTNRPVVLACDQYEDDHIIAVPFGYFGSVPFEQRICGDDAVDPTSSNQSMGAARSGVHIQHHLSSSCVQKRSPGVDEVTA